MAQRYEQLCYGYGARVWLFFHCMRALVSSRPVTRLSVVTGSSAHVIRRSRQTFVEFATKVTSSGIGSKMHGWLRVAHRLPNQSTCEISLPQLSPNSSSLVVRHWQLSVPFCCTSGGAVASSTDGFAPQQQRHHQQQPQPRRRRQHQTSWASEGRCHGNRWYRNACFPPSV